MWKSPTAGFTGKRVCEGYGLGGYAMDCQKRLSVGLYTYFVSGGTVVLENELECEVELGQKPVD